MSFVEALISLPTLSLIFFIVALLVAFGFEFINGFHDTANAVTTVIYTRSMKPTPAVIYSGFMNFMGVMLAGTGVAFGIVNLLPVDLLVDRAGTPEALVMVLSLLLAGVIWNLGTWYIGLPVSSSHTLVGSILGAALANSLLNGKGLDGVNWSKAGQTGMFLLISPMIGFCVSFVLLKLLKKVAQDPKLFVPPVDGESPSNWVRAILILTCGGVSFAHGSNDGQKGMGLLLLVLIGFLPFYYALDTNSPEEAQHVYSSLAEAQKSMPAEKLKLFEADFELLEVLLAGKNSFSELANKDRWEVRQAIFRISRQLPKESPARQHFLSAVEFVPFWAKLGTAFALGIGTMIGYKRIVITVAEKIGKAHLTYGQGAVAELVAALTILGADYFKAPVSTTQVLSSGIAGTMAANGSGVQGATCTKILLAWLFTLPCTALLAATFFAIGSWLV